MLFKRPSVIYRFRMKPSHTARPPPYRSRKRIRSWSTSFRIASHIYMFHVISSLLYLYERAMVAGDPDAGEMMRY